MAKEKACDASSGKDCKSNRGDYWHSGSMQKVGFKPVPKSKKSD